MSEWTEGYCHAKVGLLSLRDCMEMSSAHCGQCGRPICADHTIEAGVGLACPECAADDRRTKSKGWVGGARRRRDYYGGFGYYPYHYGHHRFYNHHDYNSFERANAAEQNALAANEALNQDPSAMDMDEMDDMGMDDMGMDDGGFES